MMQQTFVRLLIMLGCAMFSSTGFTNDDTAQVTYSKALQTQLTKALKNKGSDYQARTRHISNKQPIYTNRLILTDSPYLLQHAHNPVNWYPWGADAFAAAKGENKPIFLSIGYATCHWCHVMEEESFESIEVAKLLNQHFIAIKVDREQHPDIDSTYMTAVTLFTGRGGWPMSSFITAEGKPFFGGTYYPQAHFINLLEQVKTAWGNQHQMLLEQADQLATAVSNETAKQSQLTVLEQSVVQAAVQQILARLDQHKGGFSQAPKFPNEPLLLFLLQVAERQNEGALLDAINLTLSAMLQGGIYDQVGGGFHRYATDVQWRVPHFEKMLYNQAYLARVYSRAYRLTQNPLYARVVRQTLDYVLRDMSSRQGVFYSATDADSEGEEGTYFVWTVDEIKQVLKAADATFIIDLFGLTEQGNFAGNNILFLPTSLAQVASQQQQPLEALLTRLDALLASLRQYRQTKIPPLTDDKIIVAWNSMLITALAEAGDILNEPRYITAAKTAANALWQSQRPAANVLWRINLDHKASIHAKQEDYAHLAEALIALYDVSSDQSFLLKAGMIANEMLDKFLDKPSGMLVMGRDPLLFTQSGDAFDSALPSGNAVAMRVFQQLFKRTGQQAYSDHATRILQAFASDIARQPVAYAYLLAQLDELKKGEVSAHQYAANGAIKIDAQLRRTKVSQQYVLEVHFSSQADWHINSHQPLQQDLVATTINVVDQQYWQLRQIDYPEPELIQTQINRQALALYQGVFKITAHLMTNPVLKAQALKVTLNLQACNQNTCLAPEAITIYLSPPA